MAERILVTGGTGFLGKPLVGRLSAAGWQVTVLTRSPKTAEAGVEYVGHDQLDDVKPVDAVINLAGESVAGIWTSTKKDAIYSSRVDSSRKLADWIERSPVKPRVLLSGSATGIYGDQGPTPLDESFNTANVEGFLAKTCRDWEQAVAGLAWKGVRVVYLRTSNVLDPEGGYLGTMLKFLKPLPILGLGSMKAYVPWISRDDWLQLTLHALQDDALTGPLNMVSPEPTTQAELMGSIARKLRKRVWGHLPSWAVRLVAGQFSEAVLASQRILPARAEAAGFRFTDRTVEQYFARTPL